MPVKALTNTTYKKSIEFLKLHDGFGGDYPTPSHFRSWDRFVRVANMIKKYDPKTSEPIVEYAFKILKDVSWSINEWNTLWSIVYDLKNNQIYWHNMNNKNIRSLNFNTFDFSCRTPVKVFKINSKQSGDISTKFINYTSGINRHMLEKVPLRDPTYIDSLVQYPETTVCKQ